jgi:hypothetical protein
MASSLWELENSVSTMDSLCDLSLNGSSSWDIEILRLHSFST